MKKLSIALTLSLPLMASAATNLLTNGSFETGLTGWTVTNSVINAVPVSTITYGAPGSAYGEVVPTDDSPFSMSPDAAGLHALYFVDDNSVQTVSQTFTVTTAGEYELGVTSYVPLNGSLNPGEATFIVSLASVPSVELVSTLTVGSWDLLYTSGYLDAGTYTMSFALATTGGLSKDIILDRAYVVAVPEPESYAMMLAGLAGLGFLARRRQSR